jgi:hypothetical protein
MPNTAALAPVLNTIKTLNELEEAAKAAGLDTSAGNTGDPSNIPDWMVASISPTLVIATEDDSMLTVTYQQGYIATFSMAATNGFVPTEPVAVTADPDGLAEIEATAKKWIADHAPVQPAPVGD